MRPKKKFALWASVFCLFSLAACDERKERAIEAEIEGRVAKYRAEREDEQRAKLLEEASRNVDSLLLAEARCKLLDSLDLLKPGRPAKPTPIEPFDSGAAKPLF